MCIRDSFSANPDSVTSNIMVRKSHLPTLASIAGACATCPSVSDVNVLSADDGSSSFWGTGLGAYIELTLSAKEKGECWFSPPPNTFANFPECPFSWDYGTVNYAGSNNYSIQFNDVPQGGVAKLGFFTGLDQNYKQTITSGKSDTFSFVTSSGEHTSSVGFQDFPSDKIYCGSCGTQQESSSLTFDVSVPANIINSDFTFKINKQKGYKFRTDQIKLYYTKSTNSFGELSEEQEVSSSSISDSSTEDLISIAFSGSLPSDCAGLRLSYGAAVLEEMTYYASVCDVVFSSFSQQLTAYVYTKDHMGSIETPTINNCTSCGSDSSSSFSTASTTTLSPTTQITSSSAPTSSSECDSDCDDNESGSSSGTSPTATPTSSAECGDDCAASETTSSESTPTPTCDSGCDSNSCLLYTSRCV